jgi:hypothetical protein
MPCWRSARSLSGIYRTFQKSPCGDIISFRLDAPRGHCDGVMAISSSAAVMQHNETARPSNCDRVTSAVTSKTAMRVLFGNTARFPSFETSLTSPAWGNVGGVAGRLNAGLELGVAPPDHVLDPFHHEVPVARISIVLTVRRAVSTSSIDLRVPRC